MTADVHIAVLSEPSFLTNEDPEKVVAHELICNLEQMFDDIYHINNAIIMRTNVKPNRLYLNKYQWIACNYSNGLSYGTIKQKIKKYLDIEVLEDHIPPRIDYSNVNDVLKIHPHQFKRIKHDT